MRKIEPASLSYKDGVLYSERYQDIYHAQKSANEEAQHVFLNANALDRRFQAFSATTILETGFGVGVNFLETVQLFKRVRGSGNRLNYISIESHPFVSSDLEKYYRASDFSEDIYQPLLDKYPKLAPGFHSINFDAFSINLLLLFGDIESILFELQAGVDVFFLDGFSPSKNPKMWSESVGAELRRLSKPGASLSSYTVASGVRDILSKNGFLVEKIPGFGEKKEMLKGLYIGRSGDFSVSNKKVAIVGSGIAGLHCAVSLERRGFDVILLESNQHGVNTGASSNPACVLRPHLTLDTTTYGDLTLMMFLYALRHYDTLLGDDESVWLKSGVLQLAKNGDHANKLRKSLDLFGLPLTVARWVNADEGSLLSGQRVEHPGIWFNDGAWMSGTAVCGKLLKALKGKIELWNDFSVQRIEKKSEGFELASTNNKYLAGIGRVILANGYRAALHKSMSNVLKVARGQIALISDAKIDLKTVVCRDGYITPEINGLNGIGSTYEEGNFDHKLRELDHAANSARLKSMLPGAATNLSNKMQGWVGLRSVSRDRRPVLGELSEGLDVISAMGSRGFTSAPLSGEILACSLNSDPLPVPKSVMSFISPKRFRSSE